MSANFKPADGAYPGAPYTVAILSQRDAGLSVPLNYVTKPGVSLAAACFSDHVYEDESAAICISNLLANGFRKLEIDIYWDSSRRVWSFCPVAIPSTIPGAASSTRAATSSPARPISSAAVSLSSATIAGRQATSNTVSVFSGILGLSSSTTATNLSATSTADVASIVTLPTSIAGQPEVKIGQYTCTTTMNLPLLLEFLSQYLLQTQKNVYAHVLTTIINVHAVAQAQFPDLPAPTPSSFPQDTNLLSNLWLTNLSSFLYTPSNLFSDRANLNSSWFRVPEEFRPATEYYDLSSDANGIISTSQGWPSEGFLEFILSRRLLVQFGNVDPQMLGYNYSADLDTIFSPGYIQRIVPNVTANQQGVVTSGCFLRNGTESISSANSSWATAANINAFSYPISPFSSLSPTIDLVSNLTNCGISTVLNTTLSNSSAVSNFIPYRNYSMATIWSWAQSQPRNYSGISDAAESSLFRCAAISPATGRWSVTDCSQKLYAACQVPNQPYNWTLNTYQISYGSANAACPNGWDNFAVPRTALENSYLTQAIRGLRNSRSESTDYVWIDYNSLNVEFCWVTGGSNAVCPYLTQDGAFTTREVVVPSVAAVIILIISGLTVFAKAAGNRKVRKRTTRRANNGFVYEGVPS